MTNYREISHLAGIQSNRPHMENSNFIQSAQMRGSVKDVECFAERFKATWRKYNFELSFHVAAWQLRHHDKKAKFRSLMTQTNQVVQVRSLTIPTKSEQWATTQCLHGYTLNSEYNPTKLWLCGKSSHLPKHFLILLASGFCYGQKDQAYANEATIRRAMTILSNLSMWRYVQSLWPVRFTFCVSADRILTFLSWNA